MQIKLLLLLHIQKASTGESAMALFYWRKSNVFINELAETVWLLISVVETGLINQMWT